MELSIVTTIYKESQNQIERMLDSVLIQDFSEQYELIVVVDNPEKKRLYEKILDMKLSGISLDYLVVYNENNLGLAMSLNIGIKASKGKYIARIDADDWMTNDRLTLQYDLASKSNDNVLVFSDVVNVSSNGFTNEIKIYQQDADHMYKNLVKRNIISHSSALFSKSAFELVGGYRHLEPAEDYDLWLRLVDSGTKILHVPKVLVYREVRLNSISNQDIFRQVVTAKYVRELHDQRVSSGVDSYSPDAFANYLMEHGVGQEIGLKYNSAFSAWQLIKENDVSIKAIFTLFESPRFLEELILSGLKRLGVGSG